MNDRGIGRVYDKLAGWYDQNRSKALVEKPYLAALLQHVKSTPAILDLGCGTGEPIAGFLLEQGCHVTGVDGSAAMVAIGRKRFPQMEWIQADMRGLNLGRKFDAIIAWDSFFHLSGGDQRKMIAIFVSHLVRGGVLLFTSGYQQGEVYGEMNGQRVYHASLDSQEYRSILESRDFAVLRHTVRDALCGDHTVWLLQFEGTKG